MVENLFLQLENRLFGKLSASLCLLQLGCQCLDLLLVGLLPLVSLLLGNLGAVSNHLRLKSKTHLERLEVVGDHPQLLLQLEDLGLAHVGALLRLLQLRLAGRKLLGNLKILKQVSHWQLDN